MLLRLCVCSMMIDCTWRVFCESVCLWGLRVDYKCVCVKCMQVGIVLFIAGEGANASFSSFFLFCYLFEKSVRLIQYKDMKVINLCFLLLLLFPLRILVSLGICEWVGVYENEGIQLLNGLWAYETNGSWFCFVFSLNVVDLNYHCYLCVLFPCECVSLYCLKAFLYTIRYYCMVCVCLSVSETSKHVPVCFFSSPKGLSGFRFHLFKKFVSIVFPLLTIIYCVFFSLLSARTLIKHTLSAWKTLNSLLFITQWSSRHHLFYCVQWVQLFKNRMLLWWCMCVFVSRMFRLLFLCFHFLFRLTQAMFPEKGAGQILH